MNQSAQLAPFPPIVTVHLVEATIDRNDSLDDEAIGFFELLVATLTLAMCEIEILMS